MDPSDAKENDEDCETDEVENILLIPGVAPEVTMCQVLVLRKEMVNQVLMKKDIYPQKNLFQANDQNKRSLP